jgi:HK97 family phage major capsid protein
VDDYGEVKSLQTSRDTAGGYLTPPEFVREVLKAIVQFSPIGHRRRRSA